MVVLGHHHDERIGLGQPPGHGRHLVRRLVRENVGQPGLGQIDHVDGHVVAPLGLGDEPPGHGWSEAALPGAADDDRQMNTVVGHWLLLYVTKSPVWSIAHSLNVPAGAPVISSTVCVTTSGSVTNVAWALRMPSTPMNADVHGFHRRLIRVHRRFCLGG